MVANTGEEIANGWTAEQTSWVKPGKVSCADLVPPPIVGCASRTVTRSPAPASVIAAVSPFGPEPITNASRGIGPDTITASLALEGLDGRPGCPATRQENKSPRMYAPTTAPFACASHDPRNGTRKARPLRIWAAGPQADLI